MNFYYSYDDEEDDRLGKNDDWKISFYNYYKPCDYCREIFLKSDLIYVTTNIDDPKIMVETLRLCAECLTVINHEHEERIFNRKKLNSKNIKDMRFFNSKNEINNNTRKDWKK